MIPTSSSTRSGHGGRRQPFNERRFAAVVVSFRCSRYALSACLRTITIFDFADASKLVLLTEDTGHGARRSRNVCSRGGAYDERHALGSFRKISVSRVDVIPRLCMLNSLTQIRKYAIDALYDAYGYVISYISIRAREHIPVKIIPRLINRRATRLGQM